MPNYKHQSGLYRKTESPIVESVKQSEGLYKKVQIAKIEMESLTEADKSSLSSMEAAPNTKKKQLNG